MARLVNILGECSRLIDDHPPIEQPMRFGNKAFRTFHSALVAKAASWVGSIIAGESKVASSFVGESGVGASHESRASEVSAREMMELAGYLVESFGNPTRIDYGTGHECCFVVLLMLLRDVSLRRP